MAFQINTSPAPAVIHKIAYLRTTASGSLRLPASGLPASIMPAGPFHELELPPEKSSSSFTSLALLAASGPFLGWSITSN